MEEIQKLNIDNYEINVFEINYLKRIKGLYGFIYITTNLVNGRLYVGQKKIRSGWETYLGSGDALKKAIQKYGRENFERKIIDIAFSVNELNYLENLYTRMFNAVDSRKWYNICYGGINGAANHQKKPVKLFDIKGNLIEQYDSISRASNITGDSRDVIRNSCNGKIVMTKCKHIWRWAEDDFNKYPTEYGKREKSIEVKCYSIDGKFIKKYESLHEAENNSGINRTSIKSCCDGFISTAGGYVWRYIEDSFDKYPVRTKTENIKIKLEKYSLKVKCYNTDGVLLKIYNSIHEAEKETGASRANISKCCKGKSYVACGYVWRYIDDDFDKYPYREFKTGKVYRYDNNLQFIDVYENVNQASKLTGYDRSSISRCCTKERKNVHGEYWFYEGDPERPKV